MRVALDIVSSSIHLVLKLKVQYLEGLANTMPVRLYNLSENVLDEILLGCFCLTVFAAALLPLVPIWQSSFVFIALVWIARRQKPKLSRIAPLVGVVAMMIPYIFVWIYRATTAPTQHLIDSFVWVNGVPMGNTPTGLMLFAQLALILYLVLAAWPNTPAIVRVFLGSVSVFCLGTVASSIINIRGMSADIDVILAAANGWVGWVVVGMLALNLFKKTSHIKLLIVSLVSAICILSLGILLQIAIKDFSYVLTAEYFSDYFYRVRGSYYYHAPATQILAVGFPLLLALVPSSKSNAYLLFAASVAVASALYLNSTRGVALAVVCGFSVLFLYSTWNKKFASRAFVGSLLMVAVLSTSIFYVKPGQGPTENYEMATSNEPNVQSVETPKTDTSSVVLQEKFVNSNNFRKDLTEKGWSQFQRNILFGIGPGLGQLSQIRGEIPGEEKVGILSHMLLLDIASAGGIVAAIPFIAIYILPLIVIFGNSIKYSYEENIIYFSCAVSILVFILTSIFFSQERTWVVPITFSLIGALMAMLTSRSEQKSRVDHKTSITVSRVMPKYFFFGAILTTIGFAANLFFTSPSYILPTMEFLARYRSDIVENGKPVYVTSAIIRNLLDTGYLVLGMHGEIELLEDNITEIPLGSGYVIWNPADEADYPIIRQHMGIAEKRSYRQWMSINLPAGWCIQNNYLPSVQFITINPELSGQMLNAECETEKNETKLE